MKKIKVSERMQKIAVKIAYDWRDTIIFIPILLMIICMIICVHMGIMEKNTFQYYSFGTILHIPLYFFLIFLLKKFIIDDSISNEYESMYAYTEQY